MNAAIGREYAALGYGVLPVQPGGKVPATKNGLRDATTDPERLKNWQTGYNVGILPPEGVLVLDADTPEEAERLEHDYTELRDAPRCNTPRGGAHFYTRLPKGVTPPKTTVRVGGRDLDIRGGGRAYLVSPPSTVPAGVYTWRRPLAAPAELPEASAALLDLLTPKKADLPPVRQPSRGDDRTSRYASAALQAEHDAVAVALAGSRNHTLNRAAFNLGQLVGAGELDRAEVEDALHGAARTCGLEPREIEATLKSGLEAGLAQPRRVPKSDGTSPSDGGTSVRPEAPWGDLVPLPGLYPPVPTLPPELVPEPLRAWAVDIAERTSLPLEYVACPAVVAVGATVGRSVGIHPKRHDDWLVVPNLWGGIVGRPGVMKTAAISEATKPLRALAAAARERYQAEAAQAEAEKARLELEIAALKEDARRDAKKRSKQ